MQKVPPGLCTYNIKNQASMTSVP